MRIAETSSSPRLCLCRLGEMSERAWTRGRAGRRRVRLDASRRHANARSSERRGTRRGDAKIVREADAPSRVPGGCERIRRRRTVGRSNAVSVTARRETSVRLEKNTFDALGCFSSSLSDSAVKIHRESRQSSWAVARKLGWLSWTRCSPVRGCA